LLRQEKSALIRANSAERQIHAQIGQIQEKYHEKERRCLQ
jgi:hypothetical protein